MKHWINAVGYGLPSMIRLGSSYIYKGSPLLKTWYGRYDLETSVLTKLKLLKDNV